jgi:peroxiredoxin 2/4
MFNLLKIDAKAPEFELQGYSEGKFKTYKKNDFAGKWLVLFFYPGDFVESSSAQVSQLDSTLMEFKKRNIEIVGCSTDSVHSHQAWSEKIGNLGLPLLSDIHHATCLDYNVFVDETANALHSVFVISPQGELKWYQVSSQSIFCDPQTILRTIDELNS